MTTENRHIHFPALRLASPFQQSFIFPSGSFTFCSAFPRRKRGFSGLFGFRAPDLNSRGAPAVAHARIDPVGVP